MRESNDPRRVVLELSREPLVRMLRVPVFAGALVLYAVTVVVFAIIMHGWRAPITALSLLPRAVRLLAATLRRLLLRRNH
jgi:hypothetical protein